MSEIQVLSAVHGIAPRSDELLRLGTDMERGRISHKAYEERIEDETAGWIALQADAGIDIKEDGKLHWQDHLRPIVKIADGFAPDIDQGPVTRWFEDNRFYRQPTITGRLRLDYGLFEEAFNGTGEHISLLSPRSFAYLCRDEYPDLPADRNVLQLYSDLLFSLESKGLRRVTFEEYLPSALQRTERHEIDTLADWCDKLQFAVVTTYGQGSISYRQRPNLGINLEHDGLREIASTVDYRRPDFRGSEIWHQAVDAATTTLDTVPLEGYLGLLYDLAPARLVLTHNVDLECLPLRIAQEKIKRLGELAAQLKEEV